eukprot:gene13228-biopygen12540
MCASATRRALPTPEKKGTRSAGGGTALPASVWSAPGLARPPLSLGLNVHEVRMRYEWAIALFPGSGVSPKQGRGDAPRVRGRTLNRSIDVGCTECSQDAGSWSTHRALPPPPTTSYRGACHRCSQPGGNGRGRARDASGMRLGRSGWDAAVGTQRLGRSGFVKFASGTRPEQVRN